MKGNPVITFRIKQSWHAQLVDLAARQGITVSQLIREIIFAYLGGE